MVLSEASKGVFNTKRDRYPGIKAFEKGQSSLFYGREDEVAELFARLRINDCLVLYSKSGLGKSSLLNAGLSPVLESKAYLPVSIRLQLTKNENNLISVIKKNLSHFANRIAAESLKEVLADDMPLWEFFKTCDFPFGFTPVLIFDQFEELFSNKAVHQNEFLNGIREIIHTEVPVRVLDWYKNIDVDKRTHAQVDWCTQPKVKLIFSIREDRFGDIGTLTQVIPHILLNKYKLEPLTTSKAEMAIEKPAALKGTYATARFKFNETALKMIINKLSSGTRYVETTQLQIVCNEIETIVKDRQDNHGDEITVTEDLFKGKDGLNDIINNFYDRQITQVPLILENFLDSLKDQDAEAYNAISAVSDMFPDFLQDCSRELIETRMVGNGKRIFLTIDQVRDFLQDSVNRNVMWGVDPAERDRISELYVDAIINALLEVRLIRGEFREENQLFEICHDTLLIPINLAVARRKQEAEKEQLRQQAKHNEALLAAEKKKLQEERKQREIQETLRINAETAEARAQKLRSKAKEAEVKAREAEKFAYAERDRAIREKRRARKLAGIVIGLLIGAAALLMHTIWLSNVARANLYNNLFTTAEKYYNENNHFMAYSLFREIANHSNTNKDTAAQLLKHRLFFDISNGTELLILKNNRFAVLNSDKSLVIWEYAIGAPLNPVVIDSFVTSMKWSAQTSMLVYSNREGRVAVLDCTSGIDVRKKELLTKDIKTGPEIKKENSSVFAVDESEILKLSTNGLFLYLYNTRQIYDLGRRTFLPAEIIPVNSIIDRFSTITGNADKELLVISLKTRVLIYNVADVARPVLLNDTTTFRTLSYMSKDGKMAILNRENNLLEILVFTQNRLEILHRMPLSNPIALSISPNLQKLFYFNPERNVCLFSFRSGVIEEAAVLNKFIQPLPLLPSRTADRSFRPYTPVFSRMRMDSAGNRVIIHTKENILVQVQLNTKKTDTLLPVPVNKYYSSGNLQNIAWVTGDKLFYKNTISGDAFFVDSLSPGSPDDFYDIIQFSNSGSLLAYTKTGADSTELVIYDIKTHKVIYRKLNVSLPPYYLDKKFTDDYINVYNELDQEGVIFFRAQRKNDAGVLFPPLDKATRKKLGMGNYIF